MRKVDKEKYVRALNKARVKFGMTFYGHSEMLRCVIKWDDENMPMEKLTDEQLVIIAQLTAKAREPIVDELRRRELIPDGQEQQRVQQKRGKKVKTV